MINVSVGKTTRVHTIFSAKNSINVTG